MTQCPKLFTVNILPIEFRTAEGDKAQGGLSDREVLHGLKDGGCEHWPIFQIGEVLPAAVLQIELPTAGIVGERGVPFARDSIVPEIKPDTRPLTAAKRVASIAERTHTPLAGA